MQCLCEYERFGDRRDINNSSKVVYVDYLLNNAF